MTSPAQENQVPETKANDKEYNFRMLETKFQQERTARLDAEKRADEATRYVQEANQRKVVDDDDSDDEPYIDKKKLAKKFASFEMNLEKKIDQRAEEKARSMMEKDKKDSWIRNNPDFYEVLQNADKLAQHDPDLAESILEMPDTFERQRLVYKNIKTLGLHKAPQKQPSIQEKIDANRKTPYYQPGGAGAAPYASVGDFSQAGQKQAYEKLLQLKANLRL